jgi:catechol 2,3-dioxygenase-like lactoylglutathione lyase family enzyme
MHGLEERTLEANQLHRGRLIDHVHLVVKDIAASRRFYEAVFEALDVPIGGTAPDHFWVDELFISSATSTTALGRLTGRNHIAFQARNRAAVEAFHKAGVASGGTDNGQPGYRAYHPGYYAAFLLDPDGNNVEAVHHGKSQRSAASVVVTYDE